MRLRREELIHRLAALVLSRRVLPALRVGIDGPDAAGKTSLADDLARALLDLEQPVVRIGIDGFHRPAAERHRRGSLSPQGYFLDSFDYEALRSLVLDPLDPAGDGRYRRSVFGFRQDSARMAPVELAPRGAVLLLDGVFLLREELRACWELSVFVDVSPTESRRRAVVRDADLFGSEAVLRDRYLRRYLPGQEIYRATAHPTDVADVVIDNCEPARPRLLKWPDSELAAPEHEPVAGPITAGSSAPPPGVAWAPAPMTHARSAARICAPSAAASAADQASTPFSNVSARNCCRSYGVPGGRGAMCQWRCALPCWLPSERR